MQISELSRRANGWNGGGTWNNNETSSQPKPSSSTTTATANGAGGGGMMNGLTRAEALSKIEEIYRCRTTGIGISGNVTATPDAGGSQWDTGSGQQRQEGGPADKYGGETAQQQSTTQRMGSSSSWNGLNAGGGGGGGGESKALMHEGLQVYTVGQLMPRSAAEDPNTWNFNPSASATSSYPSNFNPGSSQTRDKGFPEDSKPDIRPFSGAITGSDDDDEEEERVMPSPMNDSFPGQPPPNCPPSGSSSSSASGKGVSLSKGKGNKLRVRRSTFVPGWAVPPRVLLVDDDIVSRKLGSKFLQVFGCTIDVAVDGVSAVNKMNLEKYDLVLMVRYNPRLII